MLVQCKQSRQSWMSAGGMAVVLFCSLLSVFEVKLSWIHYAAEIASVSFFPCLEPVMIPLDGRLVQVLH